MRDLDTFELQGPDGRLLVWPCTGNHYSAVAAHVTEKYLTAIMFRVVHAENEIASLQRKLGEAEARITELEASNGHPAADR